MLPDEALPNPNGLDNDAAGEWMEIYNSGTTPVDVLNWELVNKASKSLTFDSASIVGFQAGNSNTWTIQPGDYMVSYNGNSNFYLTIVIGCEGFKQILSTKHHGIYSFWSKPRGGFNQRS